LLDAFRASLALKHCSADLRSWEVLVIVAELGSMGVTG
jgi:hypothetical protein